MGSNPVGVTKTREHSSAGRALALQARCHRFESYCSHQNKESTEKSVLFWFERTVGENLYSSPLAEDGKKKQKKEKNYLFPSERQGSAYGRFLLFPPKQQKVPVSVLFVLYKEPSKNKTSFIPLFILKRLTLPG